MELGRAFQKAVGQVREGGGPALSRGRGPGPREGQRALVCGRVVAKSTFSVRNVRIPTVTQEAGSR